MSVKHIFAKLACLSMLLPALAVASCDNIFEDKDDCTLYCRIKFKYDMNMKFADAFSNSVDYVALCVYDANSGKLVHKQVESGAVLSNQDYVMQFEELTCGTYDMIAWCGDGLREGNFEVPEQIIGFSDKTTATCTMDRESDAQVTKNVKQLFHGMKRVVIENKYGIYNDTISLVKNTNTVRVILQHLSGVDVDKDQFRFEIKGANGKMDYDNSLMDDVMLTYSPWAVDAGSAGVDADIYSRTQTSVSVAIAEFTVARLMADANPILSVYNTRENDKLVLSIPLKDYALLIKGNYNRQMDDQEYLDRQDEYNLTFFLDEFGNWAAGRIIINSWHLVMQDTEI